MKRTLTTLLAVLGTAAVVTVTASAARPAGVSLVGCILANGGHATVPAGTEVTVVTGWGARSLGLIRAFMLAQTTTLAVDGVAVPDADAFYREPEPSTQATGYVTWWAYATGRALAAGESITFDFSLSLDHRLSDGLKREGGGVAGPGEVFGGTCTVTAV